MGADGTEYTGEPVEDYLSPDDNNLCTFTFPEAPPGKYTLRLPYVYLLLKQEESLTWNLRSCKPSNQVISFPGGSIRTVSITESEEPFQNGNTSFGVPVEYTHTWEIAVQCEFDNEDITALRGGYPSDPDLLLGVKAEMVARYFLYHDNNPIMGSASTSLGWRDPESGDLIYRISIDDAFALRRDLKHVVCNPAPLAGYLDLMVARYDHPMELEFEVTP